VHPGKTVDLTDHVVPNSALGATEEQVWRAPIYPALLAAVGGGTSHASRDVLWVVQALLLGLSALLIAKAAGRLWGPEVALVTALLMVIDPFSKRFVGLVLAEDLAIFLGGVTVYAFVRAWSGRRLAWWATTGVAGGLLALTRPGLVSFALLLPCVALVVSLVRARRRALGPAVALASLVIVVAPWMIWTATVTGTPTLQAYGNGVNLLIGADGAGPGRPAVPTVNHSKPFLRDLERARATAHFPTAEVLLHDSSAHARYLAHNDAILRNRSASIYASDLRRHPATLVRDYVYRCAMLWIGFSWPWTEFGGHLSIAARYALNLITLVLVLAGAAVACRRSIPARALAAAAVVATALLGLGFPAARFVIPLRPLALAFAAVAIVDVARRVKERSTRHPA
jgi:4-amino-4-deoxy-L-arabinose transferase-like glycosyltransferase